MNATINTFPPLQSMNSPRGFILAVIALLHLGFFYVLSAGLVPDLFPKTRTDSTVVFIPSQDEPRPPPEPRHTPDIPIDQKQIWVPTPDEVIVVPDDSPPLTVLPDPFPPPGPLMQEQPGSSAEPVFTQPEIDPRRALSEPMYPSRAIRAGWTGTVILSVQILENGRVGEVRVEQSSGYVELDESAKREARKWRLKPGTKDGIPVAMWKQIPITFRLKDEGSGF